MQPPNWDGRTGNNPRSMNGGFPGFPGFPEPFAGFGGLGGRSGGFLGDMFDSDSFFNDPFFSRPFGAPFGGSIFRPNSIFDSGIFGIGQGQLNSRGWSQQQGQHGFSDERPYTEGNRRNIPIEGSRRSGVKIEELPDDYDDDGHPNSNQEPVVEHPEDDDQRTDAFGSQPRSDQVFSRSQERRQTGSSDNPVRSYSFQSSSVVYGGNSGQYYSSQTTRRQGPHGLIEEEHQEKDSTIGSETHRLSRGLNDKGRSLTRKRNADGREENLERLHNLDEGEVQDFETTWETMAEKSLPKWNRSSSQKLGYGSSSTAMPAKALPYIGSSRSNRR